MQKSQTSEQNTRRAFIKKASAGAMIASIPGKSVWANSGSNMITTYIQGSVNGSGGALIQDPIELGSQGYWKNHYSSYKSYKFSQIFGGKPVKRNYKTYGSDYTLQQVLDNPGSGRNGYGGKANVNCHMAAMYLNAAHSGEMSGIYYPVIERGDFSSLWEFANYLYSSAYSNAWNTGTELSQLIDQYNRG